MSLYGLSHVLGKAFQASHMPGKASYILGEAFKGLFQWVGKVGRPWSCQTLFDSQRFLIFPSCMDNWIDFDLL